MFYFRFKIALITLLITQNSISQSFDSIYYISQFENQHKPQLPSKKILKAKEIKAIEVTDYAFFIEGKDTTDHIFKELDLSYVDRYEFNVFGNPTFIINKKIENTSVEQDTVKFYKYDSLNRPVTIVSSGNKSKIETFEYDTSSKNWIRAHHIIDFSWNIHQHRSIYTSSNGGNIYDSIITYTCREDTSYCKYFNTRTDSSYYIRPKRNKKIKKKPRNGKLVLHRQNSWIQYHIRKNPNPRKTKITYYFNKENQVIEVVRKYFDSEYLHNEEIQKFYYNDNGFISYSLFITTDDNGLQRITKTQYSYE